MKNYRKSAEELGFNLDEKSKQKVTRSTFRLSHESHQIITDLCKLLGIKKSDLFERLSNIIENKYLGDSENSRRTDRGTRKTYVVKKGTLDTLDKVAKERKENRDFLIENTVIQLMQIIKEGQTNKKERYQKMLEKIIRPVFDHTQEKEVKLRNELNDHNDPIVRRFSMVVTMLMNLNNDIERFLKDETPIDPES
jgi:hypothetical protein